MSNPSKAIVLAAAFATMAAGDAAQTAGTEPAPSETPLATMNNERLGALVEYIGSNAEGRFGTWRVTVREREVLVIIDERAGRMRIIAGVAKADAQGPELLVRVMQANFDTALDARYAIARDALWSDYLHRESASTVDRKLAHYERNSQ